jgi:hypothetical protein
MTFNGNDYYLPALESEDIIQPKINLEKNLLLNSLVL